MFKNPTASEWGGDQTLEGQDASGLQRLRRQASELLARLNASREMSERRSAETGQRDPMKFVTGRSALESAIASTRAMIEQVDEMLAQVDPERLPGPNRATAARKPVAAVSFR